MSEYSEPFKNAARSVFACEWEVEYSSGGADECAE